MIETLGIHLGVEMARQSQANDALLNQIRDREVLGHVVTEVAGESIASANEAATGKIKRQIIHDCLTGENGRAKVEGWVPRWMAFPPSAYTERGGVGTVSRSEQVGALAATVAPQPLALVRAA